jgi:hypothetical protein
MLPMITPFWHYLGQPLIYLGTSTLKQGVFAEISAAHRPENASAI